MNQIRTQLLGYIRKHQGALWAALALAGGVGLLEAATPFLLSGVFTWLGGSGAGTSAPSVFGLNLDLSYLGGSTLLTLLLAVTILKTASEYGSVTVTAWLGQAVVRDLRNDVFGRILRQPLQFFLQSSTGELISRVSTDIDRVQTAASDTLAEFLKQSAILVSLTIAIFVIDWRLALGSLVLIPLVFYPTVWFGKRLRALSRSNQQELGDMANVINEAFSGNRIVKAFSMEAVEGRRFQNITQRLFRTNLKQKMTHALSSPMMETLGIFAVVGFVLYAHERRMNPGLLMGFIFALIKLYDAVRRMSGINNSFQQAFGASSRIFEILALPEERDSGRTELAGFSNAIEFRDVQFSYNPDSPVLQHVDFEVGKGEVFAIVGASGSGKSTLVNLVPRFFDVSGGSIRIDGVDVRDCTLQSLRSQLAIVTQDVILFDDTIWGNIAYGNPAAPPDRVIAAAKAALVDDFVSVLPLKYDTRIGERGLRLSGGERQRISIARALLKDAPILILDEATSSLDSESEVYVQRALQNLMEGRTTIVIAHRLSTVRRADKIVVLQDGRIQEMGRHEDLIAKRGVYWRLHSIQESGKWGFSWGQTIKEFLYMITSMTGFGSSRAEGQNLTVLVEIKSVNHRYMDVHIKIPGEFQGFENQIRQKISSTFKRGRFDAFVRIDYRREAVKLDVNEGLIRAYVELQDRVKAQFPVQGDLTMEMLSRIPGLISISGTDLRPEELASIGVALDAATSEACRKLGEMRVIEGQALLRDLQSRVASIARHTETIAAGAHGFVEHYRAQLVARIQELAPQLVADSGHRLETEALLYAERADVAEELTRLRSHLEQFASLKDLKDEAGKRMDFILQEMNREVTTTLSKTSGLNERGAAIGQAAIEIKMEIEKLREQVQNIE